MSAWPFGVDVHHHLMVPSYPAAAREQGAGDPEWAAAHYILTSQALDSPVVTLAGRSALMLEAGIGTALLSVPAVYFPTRSIAVAAACESNRELLTAASTEPERFRVMASLPVPFADACLAELDKLAGHDLVAAVIMPPGSSSWRLDDPSFRRVWAALAEARLPVLLHPSQEPWRPPLDRWRLGPGIGVPVETSIAALELILSGTLDEVPQLELIVPQLGGVLPYLTQRLVDRGHGDAEHDVAHYLRHRLFYDNNSYHAPALRCAVETVGAGRILLGSDYPFRGTLTDCIADITESNLDPGDKHAILCSTAGTLFSCAGGSQSSAGALSSNASSSRTSEV
ncbi:amidohydrolase [Jatrophihabitans cynanchi]|uniref:6-methylsalicylate decarboxylase n=1 Tax=Jatrophihabitans cynanchi TaxID=2944128 RepID=A0ABY7K0T6_9ACTN|nr:amidohydrolase family protein [Jatrophihabitans sp. SB3-54]WAX58463.1 amidohydrolase [Jatrophihabitans sp. SB3-54]